MENHARWLRKEVLEFLALHESSNVTELLLRKSPFEDLTMAELAQQIKGRKVAEKKFPFLLKEGTLFPVGLSLEQSSSETTAKYKALGLQGGNFLDLTCGLGIDAYFLSRDFDKVVLVERNEELSEITAHNFQVLGKDIEMHNKDLEVYLESSDESFDFIYLDPARRNKDQRKVFLLEDLFPNILEIQDTLLEKGKEVWIKLSPLIDLTYLLENLKGVKEIEIIAVKGEVKEVLVKMNKDFDSALAVVKAVNLESDDPTFTFQFFKELKEEATYGALQKYLYIPNNAVLKTGAFGLISNRYNVDKLAPSTHLYTSEDLVEEFPGRILEVEQIKASQIRKGEQYNIISKNHPLKPEEIKKKYLLKDGGENYLIFTTGKEGKMVLKSVKSVVKSQSIS